MRTRVLRFDKVSYSHLCCAARLRWGLCENVIVHTILVGSPVILGISLGGKPKWLPLKFGYHDVMRTTPHSPVSVPYDFFSFEKYYVYLSWCGPFFSVVILHGNKKLQGTADVQSYRTVQHVQFHGLAWFVLTVKFGLLAMQKLVLVTYRAR